MIRRGAKPFGLQNQTYYSNKFKVTNANFAMLSIARNDTGQVKSATAQNATQISNRCRIEDNVPNVDLCFALAIQTTIQTGGVTQKTKAEPSDAPESSSGSWAMVRQLLGPGDHRRYVHELDGHSMSIGFFFGVANTYPHNHQERATTFVDAINRTLEASGLPPYEDSSHNPGAGGIGRSSLDHLGAGALARFFRFACDHGLAHAFQCSGDYDVFLPLSFEAPLRVPHGRFLFFARHVKVGSVPVLLRALNSLAPALGIPIEHDTVDDLIASSINDFQPLGSDDDPDDVTLEHLRPAWLLYHEAGHLALSRKTALVLSA